MSSINADGTLLQETQRYGLMTVEASSALVPGVGPNAIVKRLARLVEANVLQSACYIRPRKFWHVHNPPGAQRLPRDAAILCHCLLGPERWHLVGRSGPAATCVTGERREAVFVDLGATPDHVARKLRRYCGQNNLASLTGLTVLVPTQLKGESVWRAVKRHGLPLPVRSVAIDDLKEILSR